MIAIALEASVAPARSARAARSNADSPSALSIPRTEIMPNTRPLGVVATPDPFVTSLTAWRPLD